MQSPLPAFPGALGLKKPSLAFFELLDSPGLSGKGVQGGECVRERRLLEGSGTMACFPSLSHPSSAERTLKAAVRENEVPGSKHSWKRVCARRWDTAYTPRQSRGRGRDRGVSRGPSWGLAGSTRQFQPRSRGSSGYLQPNDWRDMLCFLICELNCEM